MTKKSGISLSFHANELELLSLRVADYAKDIETNMYNAAHSMARIQGGLLPTHVEHYITLSNELKDLCDNMLQSMEQYERIKRMYAGLILEIHALGDV